MKSINERVLFLHSYRFTHRFTPNIITTVEITFGQPDMFLVLLSLLFNKLRIYII